MHKMKKALGILAVLALAGCGQHVTTHSVKWYTAHIKTAKTVRARCHASHSFYTANHTACSNTWVAVERYAINHHTGGY